MKTVIRQLGVMLIAVASAQTVSAQTVDGPALYQKNCAKCHGSTGKADNWRGYLSFARNFSSAKWQQNNSDADILEEIDAGPRIMPAFKDKLSAEEKAALIQVIRSFSSE